MKVRSVKAKDVRYLAKVVGPEIGALKNMGADSDPMAVGIMLFENLLGKHVDEIWSWLADMAGMTSEELDEQPADAPLQILKAIREGDEFRPLLDALSSANKTAGNASGTG